MNVWPAKCGGAPVPSRVLPSPKISSQLEIGPASPSSIRSDTDSGTAPESGVGAMLSTGAGVAPTVTSAEV